MAKYLDRYKIIFSLVLIGLLFFESRIALAHSPHDVIDALEISPAYGQDKTVFITIGNNVYKSIDGGFSWKQLAKGLDNKSVLPAMVISPAFELDQTLFVAAQGDGIYRSRDGGSSWTKTNQGLDSLNISVLAISSGFEADQIVLAADSQGHLYQTQNGGDSWFPVITGDIPLMAIAFSADPAENMILAGDQAGNLHLSTDGGKEWQRCYQFSNAGAITSLAIAPNISSEGVLFVGTEKGGVFRSVDGGGSFVAVNNGISDQSIRSLALSPDYSTDSTLFASTWYQAVYESNDGGESWQLYNQGLTTDPQADSEQYKSPGFRQLKISSSFGQDQTLFLGGFDGLFKSADGGHVWTQMETLPLRLIRGLTLSPPVQDDEAAIAITTYGGGGYITRDRGLTWTISNKGLKTTRLTGITFSPNYDSDNTLFSASSGALLKSTDQGLSWNRIDLGPEKTWRNRLDSLLRRLRIPKWLSETVLGKAENAEAPYPTLIAISPNFAADTTLFFGTRRHGIFKSLDGGLHNTAVWDGLGQVVPALVISPDFARDGTVFASLHNNGVYRTVNNGETWQAINNGLVSTSGNAEASLALHRDTLLAISPNYKDDHTVFAGSAVGLFKTTDGGTNWHKIESLSQAETDHVVALAISPDYQNDATLLVSVKGQGLFKSNDGGLTFAPAGSELIDNNYYLLMIEFSPVYALDQTIYGASDEELFQSIDGGNHWEIIPRPVRYEDFRDVVAYEGQWKLVKGDDYSALSVTHSNVAQAKAVLNFVGTGVTWLGSKSDSQGIAKVYVDGQYEGEVDQYAENQNVMVDLYTITGLPNGAHTIIIEVADTKNPQSTDYWVEIDAFDIMP